jgi:putative restriction endonuclease
MLPDENKSRARERTLTKADYIDALKHVVRPDSTYLRMLQFHYWQTARTTTHGAMASAMGWKGSAAANLHYGKLGHRVGERLGWLPKYKVEVLAHLVDPEREHRCHWKIRGRLAAALEALDWVAEVPREVELNPDEMPEQAQLFEGAVRRVKVDAYERNRNARRQCLAHYGTWCMICGFNFKAAYGTAAEGFIHVHHIRLINEIGAGYKIDPIRDLRPVCPNCHAVIHLNPRPYTIREVREMVAAHRPPGWLDPPEVREARLRQPPDHFSRMTPKSK